MVAKQAELQGYEAARAGAVIYNPAGAGYIRLEGSDRVDFLQRQTTNDIRRLTQSQSVVTVLTSPTARILDVLTLVQEPDAIAILPLAGSAEKTARFLKGKIFFMDKVTVQDVSERMTWLELHGATLDDILSSLGLPKLAPDEVGTAQIGAEPVTLIGRSGPIGRSIRAVLPVSALQTVETTLIDLGFSVLSHEAYEVLRIEAGLPGPGELSEDYTPLEVRLTDAISDTKGCYTGQEIIARQVSYDKVTRSLVGLRLEDSAAVGTAVQYEGRTVGEVTSVAHSPTLGWIGLAVVKRPFQEAGTAVRILGTDTDVAAVVADFPVTK